MELAHDREIMSVKSMYEEALKEKDEYFNRKIVFLEKEMTSLRPIKWNRHGAFKIKIQFMCML